MIADEIRRRVLDDTSIAAAARASGVPQATLQEFAVGKPDGTFADLRLSSAQKLIDYYSLYKCVSVGLPTKGGKRMLLKNELAACECEDSPEKFRERLIDALENKFGGNTIDALLCNPRISLEYCNYIREGVGSESLCDPVILKALINIRKRKNCPTGLRSKGRRRVLTRLLKDLECDLSPDDFKDALLERLSYMYRDITIDELVCHPREALAYCNYVRKYVIGDDLTDEMVLSTLMNIRKAN